jgi:KDO2-lipid IV(A) lauroyltransferase
MMFSLNWRKMVLRGFSRFPWWFLYGFSSLGAWLLYAVIRYRRKVVFRNLKLAFPNKSERERRAIALDFYRNLSDIAVETVKSDVLTAAEARERMSLQDEAGLADLYNKGRGVMVVMGHFTNFEWTAMCLELFVPHKTFAVYHPIKNGRLNAYMTRVRQKFGMTLFKMRDTYPFMLNQVEDRPLYIFMADQSPHKGKIKYAAPFFHPYTPVHLGVENLSLKCNLAVVFLTTHRLGRGRYVMRTKLLSADPSSLDRYELTRLHMKHLEEEIRKSPASWMWSHKRWKNVDRAAQVMQEEKGKET